VASSSEQGWITLRNKVPVEGFLPRELYQKAWDIERDLEFYEVHKNPDKAYRETIKANKEVSEIINEINRRLNRKYQEAREYEKVAEAFYRLIGMNLRFYRWAEIDKLVEEATDNTGNVRQPQLIRLQQNLEILLNSIRKSLALANEDFESDDEYEDEVIYIVAFAQHLESSLRYTAKHRTKANADDGENRDGPGIQDYYQIIEMAKPKDAANKMNEQLEQEQEFVEDAEQKIEDQFKEEMEEDSEAF